MTSNDQFYWNLYYNFNAIIYIKIDYEWIFSIKKIKANSSIDCSITPLIFLLSKKKREYIVGVKIGYRRSQVCERKVESIGETCMHKS